MDVQITDSFTKSLKRLMWHESKVYKVYALFRYDIAHFLKNIWRFRKELWSHAWWDYRFTLNMLERSLTIMEKGMSEKGMEVSESREPKVMKMRRGIEQEFVDVVVEGKRLSEDWEDTKTIFSITFYDMLNKYLFDKEVQGVFVKHEDFVKTTMQREGARLNEIIYFLVNNYLIKQTGEAPKPEVPRLEGHPDSVKSYSPEQVVEVEDKIIKVFVEITIAPGAESCREEKCIRPVNCFCCNNGF